MEKAPTAMLTIPYDLCVGRWFVSSSAVDTGMKVSIICTQVSHQFSPDNVCLITDDPVLLECVTHLPSHVTRYVTPVPGSVITRGPTLPAAALTRNMAIKVNI